MLYAVTVIDRVADAVLPRLSVMVTLHVCVPEDVMTTEVWVALVDDVEVVAVEMTVDEAFVTVKAYDLMVAPYAEDTDPVAVSLTLDLPCKYKELNGFTALTAKDTEGTTEDGTERVAEYDFDPTSVPPE